MKKISLAILLTILAATTGFYWYQNREVATVTVEVTDKGFNPTDITIGEGTRVIFKNTGSDVHWPASDLHPTHGVYPEFDPMKAIDPGQEWSFVFRKPGNWKAHDHVYPQFRAIIHVE